MTNTTGARPLTERLSEIIALAKTSEDWLAERIEPTHEAVAAWNRMRDLAGHPSVVSALAKVALAAAGPKTVSIRSECGHSVEAGAVNADDEPICAECGEPQTFSVPFQWYLGIREAQADLLDALRGVR